MASAVSHVELSAPGPDLLRRGRGGRAPVPVGRGSAPCSAISPPGRDRALGLRLIDDPEPPATVAELGVVLLLFIVGLELKPVPSLAPCGATSSASAPPSSPVTACRHRRRRATRLGLLGDGAFVAGHRARPLRDRDRAADAGGARRPADALWAAHLRDPAVPGPRPIVPLLALAAAPRDRRRRGPSRHRLAGRLSASRRRCARDRRRRAGRPLCAQSVLPPAGRAAAPAR